MIVFLSNFEPGAILVMARMEGDDGTIGDLEQVVRPGGQFMGRDFEALKQLGDGEHDIAAPPFNGD